MNAPPPAPPKKTRNRLMQRMTKTVDRKLVAALIIGVVAIAFGVYFYTSATSTTVTTDSPTVTTDSPKYPPKPDKVISAVYNALNGRPAPRRWDDVTITTDRIEWAPWDPSNETTESSEWKELLKTSSIIDPTYVNDGGWTIPQSSSESSSGVYVYVYVWQYHVKKGDKHYVITTVEWHEESNENEGDVPAVRECMVEELDGDGLWKVIQMAQVDGVTDFLKKCEVV